MRFEYRQNAGAKMSIHRRAEKVKIKDEYNPIDENIFLWK